MRLSALPPDACFQAFAAWRASSGLLLPYVKATPFVALARYSAEMDLPEQPTPPPLPALADLAPDELLLLDLPGAACLACGLDAARSLGRWPIVTFGHWYHPHGLVGSAAAAALLLLHAPAPPAAEPRAAIFLLDYDRYQDQPLSADRFNNQYELTEQDLPTAAELQHLGYQRACIISADPPKDDLGRYAAYLAAAGLPVRWQS